MGASLDGGPFTYEGRREKKHKWMERQGNIHSFNGQLDMQISDGSGVCVDITLAMVMVMMNFIMHYFTFVLCLEFNLFYFNVYLPNLVCVVAEYGK